MASGAPPLHVDAHAAWIQTGPRGQTPPILAHLCPFPRTDSGIHVAFLIRVAAAIQNGPQTKRSINRLTIAR